MPKISINITDDQHRHIQRLGNCSKYIRGLIDSEMRDQMQARCDAILAIHPAFMESLIVAGKNGNDFTGIYPAFNAKLQKLFGETYENCMIESYFLQKITVFDQE